MARLLTLDGTELCELLAFARQDDSAIAQVRADDAPVINGATGELLFEDDRAQRFLGKIISVNVGSRGGAATSMIIKVKLSA